ncbi:tubulin polymerization-promoting protein family member 3-like isoform X1 [Argonauta hians]
MADLNGIFRAFAKLSGAKYFDGDLGMTNKAISTMVRNSLPKEVVDISDRTVFPRYKARNQPYMPIHNFPSYLKDLAREYAKYKSHTGKYMPYTHPCVEKYYQNFIKLLELGRNDIVKSDNGSGERLNYKERHKRCFGDIGNVKKLGW